MSWPCEQFRDAGAAAYVCSAYIVGRAALIEPGHPLLGCEDGIFRFCCTCGQFVRARARWVAAESRVSNFDVMLREKSGRTAMLAFGACELVLSAASWVIVFKGGAGERPRGGHRRC